MNCWKGWWRGQHLPTPSVKIWAVAVVVVVVVNRCTVDYTRNTQCAGNSVVVVVVVVAENVNSILGGALWQKKCYSCHYYDVYYGSADESID